MELFKSLAGMVYAELTSANIPGSLTAANDRGVRIHGLETVDDLTVRFYISRPDFRIIRAVANRRGESVRILGRSGIYWRLKGLLRRPLLLCGFAVLLAMMLFLPSRVLFVQVEGNETVPSRLILAAAEESGICFGASRREVRSEKMKNALLSAVPQLQWAGVNTYGCTAVISVRERAAYEETEEDHQVSSIVAAREGIILSGTVTRGNGLFTEGQAVQPGEVLISGYTDCGLSITATRAEGEVMALTKRDLTAVTPSQCQIRGTDGVETTKYSLIVGKKRINFLKGSGISDATCVKMYTEYCLTLPGGFQLPVTFVKETFISGETAASDLSRAEASQLLSQFASLYLKQQMIAGSIAEASEQIRSETGIWRLTGEYVCTEMIGRRQTEQIGVIP